MPDIDLWTYRAKFVRAVDGDTVVMTLDLGFRVAATHSIRLAGVDAPEMFTGTDREEGIEARDRLLAWLIYFDDPDSWPFLVRTERDRQSFNRYIGEVWVADWDSADDFPASLNEWMRGA